MALWVKHKKPTSNRPEKKLGHLKSRWKRYEDVRVQIVKQWIQWDCSHWRQTQPLLQSRGVLVIGCSFCHPDELRRTGGRPGTSNMSSSPTGCSTVQDTVRSLAPICSSSTSTMFSEPCLKHTHTVRQRQMKMNYYNVGFPGRS